MLNVGVIGLGMMGVTHLDVYSKLPGVKVVAVADLDPNRRSGKTIAAGNIEGHAKGQFDFSTAKQYAEGLDLINDPDVQVVDICLITPLHRKYAEATCAAGKHMLLEKPLARTHADAVAIADAAEKAKIISMPAMCMRFWPGWTWLKETVADQRYGKTLSASFRRIASHPGGRFYEDGAASGGALLDLHIHDTDFVNYCFGPPAAVHSRGYSTISGAPDHVLTSYIYPNGPVVSAEGSWSMPKGFPFTMQYMVAFEKATAMFDLAAAHPLMLYEKGKDPEPIEIAKTMGYEHEIAYFVECLKAQRAPSTVTLRDAADAIRIVEAEAKSIQSGQIVPLT
jgi:predicted dehydrogenase